jgi:hypothetical protein
MMISISDILSEEIIYFITLSYVINYSSIVAYHNGHIFNIRMTVAILATAENSYEGSIHNHIHMKGYKEIKLQVLLKNSLCFLFT